MTLSDSSSNHGVCNAIRWTKEIRFDIDNLPDNFVRVIQLFRNCLLCLHVKHFSMPVTMVSDQVALVMDSGNDRLMIIHTVTNAKESCRCLKGLEYVENFFSLACNR